MRVPVAIAHDYLTQRGGAERVVLALARAFPDAPIYTTLYDPDGTYPEFRDLDVRTSGLNRIPRFRRHHRLALPFLPWASNSIFIDADVVVASSSGWAHGFRTPGRKLVYCYSPARWLYEPDRYLGEDSGSVATTSLRLMGPMLRHWDRKAARTATTYLAISGVTQGRIKREYGRDAKIVPAPHSVVSCASLSEDRGRVPKPGYFLVVSRLLPYKNVRPVVQAFKRLPDHQLLIVGAGPQRAELAKLAGANVTMLSDLTDEEMAAAYAGCVGLIAASHEDFGLTPLEAAAHGKPSVVLRWGGFLDTVVEDETGVFFDDPLEAEIAAGVSKLSARLWDSEVLRARADQFTEGVFADTMRAEVTRLKASAGFSAASRR